MVPKLILLYQNVCCAPRPASISECLWCCQAYTLFGCPSSSSGFPQKQTLKLLLPFSALSLHFYLQGGIASLGEPCTHVEKLLASLACTVKSSCLVHHSATFSLPLYHSPLRLYFSATRLQYSMRVGSVPVHWTPSKAVHV